jgi:hypothetical protein
MLCSASFGATNDWAILDIIRCRPLKELQFQAEAAKMVEGANAETPALIMIGSNLPHTIAQEGLPALRGRSADVNGSEF